MRRWKSTWRAASAAWTPARAISSSRPGALPPLMPIAPMVTPFGPRIGQPPGAMINLPWVMLAMLVAKPGMSPAQRPMSAVDWLNMTAEVALAVAMPAVAQAYGAIMRSNATRWPALSTSAMLTWQLNSRARALLASSARLAISRERLIETNSFVERDRRAL